jgi:1A family penicillin-binding protein
MRKILTVLLALIVVGLALTFIGVGFVGGVVIASWSTVREVDLGQLEYRQVDTWKQHLEVYSSICGVQRGDAVNFLLNKLRRLEYVEDSKRFAKPGVVGQYSLALDASGQNGSVWIFLQGFHFPRANREPHRVEVIVNYGKITAIRNDEGREIDHFDLRPELISELYNEGGEAREIVKLVQMPDTLLRAFRAVEDRRFYQHYGVDWQGVARAFAHNISLYLGLSSGTPQGASTITQQLTRNIYLSPEQNYLRKIKEALLAIRIERQFSKDEIFEKYLNLINLGRFGSRDVLGVQEAAKSYFGKPVWELELHECALLAAIPKSPPRYSPLRNPELARERRDLVLSLMLRSGDITQGEYEESVKKPLRVLTPEDSKGREIYHFLDYIHEQLTEIPALEGRLYNQGLKVYTTIDMSMQKVAERAVAEHLQELDKELRAYSEYRNLPDYDENKNNPNGIHPIKSYLQAGMVAIEPQTGYIRTMVGGRDYFMPQWYRQRGIHGNFFNRAVQAIRQPGSAFKPIVFAAMFSPPALATPATVIRDEPWSTEVEPGKRWTPTNYRGDFHGDVTLRTVLEKSINVATARLMNETRTEREGVRRTIETAKRLGIESSLYPGPALALGASGVTVLELTSAYSAFANGGVRAKPISIQYVEDRNGEILVENQIERKQVLNENVAYLVSHLMEGVIQNGTGRGAIRQGLTRPAAGKTGTTDEYTDAWFVGFVPDLAVGVWVGFDDPQKSARKEGAQAALPIWTKFMLEATRGPVKDFRAPSGVVFREIDRNTGLLRNPGKCPEDDIIREAFLIGNEPRTLCNAHE